MTAYDAKGSGNGVTAEATKYLYTSTINGSWQTGVVDPDSTDVLSQDTTTEVWSITTDNGDHTTTGYDRLGRTTSTTDQRGVTHNYTYDWAGRLSADAVDLSGEHSGQNVDDTVLAIVTGYDDLGRVQTVTSYPNSDGTGTAVNQVEDVYDGWGNLVQEYQSHSGVATTSTPSVQYTYADGADVNGKAAYLRLTQVAYPNGQEINYNYNAGPQAAVDQIMSRLGSISDSQGSATDAVYTYLGLDTIVKEDYQQAGVMLDDILPSTGAYAGFDRFGRASEPCWWQHDSNGTITGKLAEDDYWYDREGNVTTHIEDGTSGIADSYAYDALNRLTSWLEESPPGWQTTQSRSWSLDALGNDLSSGTGGTYNAANEETPNTGSSGYDLAGNMVTLQSGKSAIYDAWNRLTEVDSGSNVVEKYQYDGTNRRVQTFTNFSGSTATVTDDYLSGQQVVESDITTGWNLSSGGGASPAAINISGRRGTSTPRFCVTP